MASPISALIATAKTTLEALAVPDDGTSYRYRELGTLAPNSLPQHRTFEFLPLFEGEFVRGTGPELTVIRVELRLALYLLQMNRPGPTFTLDSLEDCKTIMRWWAAQHESGWGAPGIENVEIRGWRAEPASNRFIFPLRITSQETD